MDEWDSAADEQDERNSMDERDSVGEQDSVFDVPTCLQVPDLRADKVKIRFPVSMPPT